jgi:hypothetical protein
MTQNVVLAAQVTRMVATDSRDRVATDKNRRLA